jgi:hypothetical protein
VIEGLIGLSYSFCLCKGESKIVKLVVGKGMYAGMYMFIFFVSMKRKKYLGCFLVVRVLGVCERVLSLKKSQVKKFYSSILSRYLIKKG